MYKMITEYVNSKGDILVDTTLFTSDKRLNETINKVCDACYCIITVIQLDSNGTELNKTIINNLPF